MRRNIRKSQAQMRSFSQKIEVIIKSYTIIKIEKCQVKIEINDINTVGSHFICVSKKRI